ncbi:ABC transporter permease [Clostridium sediminicola]|uniref:ABC transporter permease n=1 Tax=Clostridium sediminicola TaxID=3114879 RepID=UPI0031F239FB
MINAVILEFFKLRRKKIFIMITAFLSIELLWAFMATSKYMSSDPSINEWHGLFYMITSMNGFFLPIISAIVASRIWDMEYKGGTWKLLICSNLHPRQIYLSKYICSCALMLYAIILQALAIGVFGSLKSFSDILSIPLFVSFIRGTMLTSMAILALQQWVSSSIKNQAFALCLGMVGGFIGLVSDLLPLIIRPILIWSYYTYLSPVKYQFINSSIQYTIKNPGVEKLSIAVAMTLIFYIIGNIHISKKEV